jgi:hypothetical protein
MNIHVSIFSGIGVSLLLFSLWIRWRESLTRGWAQVIGKVVLSRIDKEDNGHGAYQFVPVIEYNFEYGSKMFRSSHRCFGNYVTGRQAEAEAVVSRYPVGSTVTVFVNAKVPEKSVLEHGSRLSWVPFAFGIGFIALALVAFFFGRS